MWRITNSCFIKDAHKEKARLKWNSSANEKCEYEHLGSWYIKSTLYMRFINWKKIVKKIKWLLAKLQSFLLVHFVLSILIVLTFASDKVVSMEILSFELKNGTPVFWKRFLFSRKLVLKLKMKKVQNFQLLSH